jgi:hypothetical protein
MLCLICEVIEYLGFDGVTFATIRVVLNSLDVDYTRVRRIWLSNHSIRGGMDILVVKSLSSSAATNTKEECTFYN